MEVKEMRKKLRRHCQERVEDCIGCVFAETCEGIAGMDFETAPEEVVYKWYAMAFPEPVFASATDAIRTLGSQRMIFADTPCSTTIKDSGERHQFFEGGGVRDIQKGKGRCDLMPLDVISWLLNGGVYGTRDSVIDDIALFQQCGDVMHLYYALATMKSAFGGTETMILEVSKHFEDGCEKYGENNWQRGLPVKSYINSGVRHYLKWLRGDKDEPHDRAFVWNILCAIWTCKHKPELNEYAKKGGA